MDMMGGQSNNKNGFEPPPPSPPQSPPQSSKKKGVEPSPPPPQHLHLISYAEAYRLDPDLQSFDSTLRERTNRVLSSLSTGIELGSLSFDSTLHERTYRVLSSLIEVGSLSFDSLNCLLDISQDVVNVILQSKEDIRKNKKLFSLVEEYFESSAKTLDFCAVLESFLERARNSELIIQVALRKFEEELALCDGAVEMNFKTTLEQLGKFEGAGDPFSEVFFVLFESVYRQQVSMLEKLQDRMKKIDNSLWNNYVLKVQKELVSSMQVGTFIAIKDVDNLRLHVDRLENDFDSLLHLVDLALINKDALKIVMDEIKKKMEVFIKTIELLGEHASLCSRSITRARTLILQRITCYPDLQSSDSFREVTNGLLDMNQAVVNVILESKDNIRKNKKLFSLVEEYFESSLKTLDFCAVLENLLERAQNSKLILLVALAKFEEEVALYGGVVEMNFKKTLEQLGKFEGAGDPFNEVFFVLFQSVYRQQVSMLEKLQDQKKKLDNSRWKNYMLKVQKELVSSMRVGTSIAIMDADNILVLVNKLENCFDSLLQVVDFALINKDTLKIVIDEIKKKMVFMETIELLGEHASRCSRHIKQVRTLILQRINCYPDGPEFNLL